MSIDQIDTLDPAGQLAEFAANLQFDDIPIAVIDLLKQRVLDTLSCALGGATEAPISELREYATSMGGAPQSRIWVFGDRVPAHMAAFVNGPMARALDLGDCHPEGQHMSEYILPTMFALSQSRGPVSGKDFLTAYCAGGEVQARIGNACFGLSGISSYGRISNYTQWGAIVGGARLLKCDSDKLWNAMGIGYSILGSGDFQCVAEGNQMMRVKHGFTSADALHAVELAQRGITGTRNIFLGSRGLLETHFHKKNDPTALTRGLGEIWEWPESMTKGYACCYGAHAGMTGVEQLMKQHQLSIGDIARIKCGLHPTPFGLVADNYEKKWHPQTAIEAQFSLPYCVATIAVHKRLLANELSPDALLDPTVRALMPKIEAYLLPKDVPTFSGRVELELVQGQNFVIEVPHPYGSPGNPLGWEGEISKFHACAALMPQALKNSQLERVIELCQHFEELDDVSVLIDALCV